MLSYPKVGRKLPDLFEEIIHIDDFLKVVSFPRVVSWPDFRAASKRKRELIKAAENYIKQSKKDIV